MLLHVFSQLARIGKAEAGLRVVHGPYAGGVVTVDLSRHAVERFQERVRPALMLGRAEDELARLVASAELTGVCPGWVSQEERERPADAFAVLSDGVCLILYEERPGVFSAVTCIARYALSEETRGRRNAARRAERARRRRLRRNAGYRKAEESRERPMAASR